MNACLRFWIFISIPQVAYSFNENKSLEDGRAQEVSSKWIIPPPLQNLKKDYKVRLIYFVPSDCETKANYLRKCEVLMRVVSDFYMREMKAHGLRTSGLDFEFDELGRLKVHHVKARNPAVFYTGNPFDVTRLLNTQQQEIWEATGFSRNRALLVFSEAGAVAEARPLPQVFSGLACVSAQVFRDEISGNSIESHIELLSGDSVSENNSSSFEAQTSNGVLIHELGHIFGMLHDTRDPRNVMMRGYNSLGKLFHPEAVLLRPVRFSAAHARMAAATRFFSSSFDEKDNKPPSIIRFAPSDSLSLKSGTKSFEFSIKIKDSSGLSSFIVLQRGGGQIDALVGEVNLEGKKVFNESVRFKCPRPLLGDQPLIYIMNVIDVNGNLAQRAINSRVLP